MVENDEITATEVDLFRRSAGLVSEPDLRRAHRRAPLAHRPRPLTPPLLLRFAMSTRVFALCRVASLANTKAQRMEDSRFVVCR